jgi:glycosyltransferase involved in cell wall biosynthesis
MNLINRPEISIVTVVYNNVDSIEDTILSVINQTYKNIEYIIIDGGSTDGTVDVIKKYANRINLWKSEPDEGLYFAMNKGLELASGQWINFMNSGDTFYSHTTIEQVFSNKYQEGVIYGDVMFSFDRTNEVLVKANDLKYFWKGMQFVHQAAFVSTDLMKEYQFDTQYNLIADYNSLYKIFLSGANFQYLGFTICNFLAGGLSDNNPKSIIECQHMIFPLHQNFSIRLFYYYRYIECTIKYNFAKRIGQSNYAIIRRMKNKCLNLLKSRLKT